MLRRIHVDYRSQMFHVPAMRIDATNCLAIGNHAFQVEGCWVENQWRRHDSSWSFKKVVYLREVHQQGVRTVLRILELFRFGDQ